MSESQAEKLSARLLAEWSMGKVRILHQGSLWWCWDKCGYTRDMAEAGLYDADWEPSRDSDEVRPVDPKTYPIDALMQFLKNAEQRGAAAERDAMATEIARQLDLMAKHEDEVNMEGAYTEERHVYAAMARWLEERGEHVPGEREGET